MSSLPLTIYDSSGNIWNYLDSDKSSHTYMIKKDGIEFGGVMKSHIIEKEFTRKIVEPKSKIITQGRWECAPAALAMLLNQSLWDVKRALVHCGWNNDDYGTPDHMLIKSAKLLGFDLIQSELINSFTPAVISVPSVNLKGRTHALYWNGEEMLDPNFGIKERKHYSPEWSTNTIWRNSKVLMIKGSK